MTDLYACQIDDVLGRGKQTIIPNSGRHETKVLIMKLLRRAKKEVVIFCHRLAHDVWGSVEVCEALVEAYRNNPDLNVRVFIRDKAPAWSPFVSTLISHGVRVRANIQSDETDVFLVDGIHGREESKVGRKAKGHFYDKAWVDSVKERLEKLA